MLNCLFNKVADLYLFLHDAEKWPNILLKSCGASTVRFSKYVRPFFNIMQERVNSFMTEVATI